VLAEKSNYSPPPTSTSSIAQASPSLAPQKSPAAKVPATPAPEVALAQSVPTPVRAQPVQPSGPDMGTLASTTGGGTWKTFPAGRMPLGRLIGTNDLKEIAAQGTGG